MKVNLNYGDIPIYSTTLDLCDILEQLTSDSCPLSKGAHDIDIKQTIPGFAPGVREVLLHEPHILYVSQASVSMN